MKNSMDIDNISYEHFPSKQLRHFHENLHENTFKGKEIQA